jgi:hypothetical protein
MKRSFHLREDEEIRGHGYLQETRNASSRILVGTMYKGVTKTGKEDLPEEYRDLVADIDDGQGE